MAAFSLPAHHQERTTEPRGCYGLAVCPEGSKTSPKFGVLAIFLVFAIIAYIVFRSKSKTDEVRRLKHKLQADAFAAPKDKVEAEKPQLAKLTNTFDIRFENLGKTLPTGVEIMRGVSGELKSGRTCAIMGPSGAGKTTFVTLLTGKMSRSTGTVYVNNTKEELSKYKKLIGYVPQEDVMLRELTVRDILMHSARMRLPADWSHERIRQKVLEIIHFLEMSHVMDNVIGDEEERGISGGQRKRVNIGMELVAEPSILFLDEPTSGLDSSTAFEVCANLRNIAQQQGLLVAAVIHSPSPATFRQFDDLLLLGKGGQVVYFGNREDAVTYFDSIGFTCPPDESPSDFFMDVTSGKVPSAYDADFVPSQLFEYWNQHAAGKNPFEGRQKQDPYALLALRTPATPASSSVDETTHLTSDDKDPLLLLTDLKKKEREAKLRQKKLASDYYRWTDYVAHGLASLVREWGSWVWDVLKEIGDHWMRFFYLVTCKKDPVRQTCGFHIQLWLLLKRSAAQVWSCYRLCGS
ncbi:hypothetical protein HDV00_012746 [Rhizophlyctis rosea]|nr:hypothetical protein HDV00_012746 [Rhizophlyctis rosea]